MRHTKKASQIKEVKYNKDYAGTEASPYWDWMDLFGLKEQEQLTEEDTLYPKSLEDIDEDKINMIKSAWPLLSDKQKQALQLVGYEGKTLENTGAIMGINKSNVLDLIKRARKVIKSQAK